MDKHFAQVLRYGFIILMTCNATIHAYRILVSNGSGANIYAAVYRYNDEQPFRIRTSASKLIKSGETAWFGGVLPDSEHVHFQLYGASARKSLTEALNASSSATEPYFIFDVGTGNQTFVIVPPPPAPPAPAEEQPAQSNDELQQPDVQPAEQTEVTNTESATTEEIAPTSDDHTSPQEASLPTEQPAEDAVASEQADITPDQISPEEKQGEDDVAAIASDMSAADHLMSLHDRSSDEYDVILHDEHDMQRSHLLRIMQISLAAEHSSHKEQATAAEDDTARMSPHRQRPQKHLHRTQHA